MYPSSHGPVAIVDTPNSQGTSSLREWSQGPGSLTVTDDVAFSSPQTFSTAMITFGAWKQLDTGSLRVEEGGEAIDAAVQTDSGELELKAEEIHEDVVFKRTPIHLGIHLTDPVDKARLTVTITPLERTPPGPNRSYDP